MTKTLRIIGWITCITLFLGAVFKTNQWFGSSVLLILYCFLFIFFYLPLWLNSQLKSSVWKFYDWSQYIVLTIWSVSGLFKLMHWNGTRILVLTLIFLVLFILLPMFFVYVRKTKSKNVTINYHSVFIFILFIINFSLFTQGVVSKSLFDSVFVTSKQIKKNYESLSRKNNLLYNSLNEAFTENEKEANIYYLKSQMLKTFTNSADDYIHHLKSVLISTTLNVTQQAADTINITDIDGKLNFDIPTMLLCSKNNGQAGKELKQKIEMYRDSVFKFVDKDKQNFIREGILLNTDDSKTEDGEVVSWVNATFYQIPLAAVLSTLSNMQVEMKFAEQQVLSELFNQALVNKNNNIAAKIAEYGVKYENEKKEKEIALLKKDQELDMLLLKNKNEELSSQDNVLNIFSVFILLAVVLVFYIIRSNIQRKKANRLLEQQNKQIETQKREITDSISYAKRLQTAILPDTTEITSHFPNSFIFYQPKDIVSGDFYFFKNKNNQKYLAVADCTGHGVPGAFMSVVCSEKLHQAINEKNEPAEILNYLNRLVKETLKQTNNDGATKDGMDICFCKFEHNKISYSGANRPLWIIKKNTNVIEETKATKVAIGGFTEDEKLFDQHSFDLETGDLIYLFSDGYADQFGGELSKKLTTKKLKELILSIHSLPMIEQEKELRSFFENWKKELEQVDDILIIGLRL